MLNISNYYRNVHQNYNEVPSHTNQMAFIKKSTNNKSWRGCGEKRTLLHGWWEWKLGHCGKQYGWMFLRKLNIHVPYHPVIPLLGMYLDKSFVQKDTYKPMFTAPLFSIAKTWKHPKGPSTDEQIKERWNTYIIEYYSAIKKPQRMPFAAA